MGFYELVYYRGAREAWLSVSTFGTRLINSDDVNRIVNKWIEMVTQNGIWEHYNPETGRGYGAEGLGMSCLIVDWMARLGIVNIHKA